jgi:hypothetical protein
MDRSGGVGKLYTFLIEPDHWKGGKRAKTNILHADNKPLAFAVESSKSAADDFGIKRANSTFAWRLLRGCEGIR